MMARCLLAMFLALALLDAVHLITAHRRLAAADAAPPVPLAEHWTRPAPGMPIAPGARGEPRLFRLRAECP